jgi:hypothetical protein
MGCGEIGGGEMSDEIKIELIRSATIITILLPIFIFFAALMYKVFRKEL